MKIGILLGSPKISGGTYVIYEHASRLKRRGHQVILITQECVTFDEYSWHPSAGELEWLPLAQAKSEKFDIVLATWWRSPFMLHELQSVHYAYFVQSIETRFFQEPNPENLPSTENFVWKNLCEQTYSYNIPIITEAAWIQEYLCKYYNNCPWLVRNGIRKDIYTPYGNIVAPRQKGRLRVLVEGPVHVAYKNVPASVRLAKQAGVDEIWLLTSSEIDQYSGVDRVFSQIPIHETPAVYRSCDILLKLSYVEGMFGPPLEMFHCGGTALVYNVTGHDEYIVFDQNSYVVAKDDESEVVRLLCHLKENPDELERLKQGAAKTASKWPDWAECSAAFENILLEISKGKSTSREYLQKRTQDVFSLLDLLNKANIQDKFADREKNDDGKNNNIDRNNFIQFYWDSSGLFNEKKSQWRHYSTNEWTTVSFEIYAEEAPLWLRIDPSIRLGIIHVEFITVYNETRGGFIATLTSQSDFKDIFVAGDASCLSVDRRNIFFSHGYDPILILPKLLEHQLDRGDCIEVQIRLKETSIHRFFADQRICFLDSQSKQGNSRDNILRLRWDGCGNFSREKLFFQQYQYNKLVTLSFSLPVDEVPLWLRFDLSIRVSVIEVSYIDIENTTRGKKIMTFCHAEDFNTLLISGDLLWIAPDKKNIILSGGPDSICILPQIEAKDASVGDLLTVTIKLKESSLRDFFAHRHITLAESVVPRRKRLLQLFRNRI
ncbi:glycosyltransferase family 4 protein [Desulfobulbus sp. F4]|nr:glycosyltransferase family 4 protein [Desulfobulbus sp. F3]MCW5200759.1 glycosyltransferase family 4 protein [Desulfobulbus sp. F4]